jgi:hypothetical protein
MTQTTPIPSKTPSALGNLLTYGGIIVALLALVDFSILLLPPEVGDVRWRLNVMSQLVDRGIIPLIGFALVLWGFWIQACQGFKERSRSTVLIPIFVLAGILGITYFGIMLFYLSDNNEVKVADVAQVEQQAKQREAQLDNRLTQELGQINVLLQNEDQLQQQLQNNTLSSDDQAQLEQLLAQLEPFKNDPEALRERTAQTRDEALSLIRQQKETRQKAIRESSFRAGIRIPLSSLFLALGYLFLSILGFQQGSS